ncbi:hypothetical protein INT47_007737 [Mucor saturninus]|uniref:FAS1 domain-containing protein n=1 Tax=Mucor saturninus TaxID=64648 RepID=A0A8H7UZP5_9FUNG|nr:hypothetical protein INT47_007737 [Mucor saturninus]
MRSSIFIATLCAFGFVHAQQPLQPQQSQQQPQQSQQQPQQSQQQPQQSQQQPQQSQQTQQTPQPQQTQQPQQPQQQQPAGTIFQILNKTDGTSPAPKFAQFIQSSPDYQPIVDLLNDPTNNLTMFVPSDGLFYNITGQQPPIIKQVTTTVQTTVKVPASTVRVPASTVVSSATVTASASTVTARASTVTARASTVTSRATSPAAGAAGGFGMSDIMSALRTQNGAVQPTHRAQFVRLANYGEDASKDYFIQEGQVAKALAGIKLTQYIDGDNNNGQSLNFTNVSTSPFVNEFSVLDLLYYHVSNGSVNLQQNETMVLNTILRNETVDRLGFGSPLVVQPVNSTGNLTVGDGLGHDAFINQTYNASNGALYIIDKVLVPPTNISNTMNALTDTSFFEQLLERSSSTWDSLNNYNNFTVFVPNNNALQNVDLSNFEDDVINNLISAHIFQGVIYSSNITNTTDVSAQSLAGTDVVLQRSGNSPNFTVSGTNVVQPNILLNNGVMHLIDGVLSFPATEPAQTTALPADTGPFTSETATEVVSQPAETATEIVTSEPAPTATEEATALSQSASPSPTRKLSAATVPTLASMLVLLSSTFVFYFLYV